MFGSYRYGNDDNNTRDQFSANLEWFTGNMRIKAGVMYTYETPQLMPYIRSLAPTVIKIRRDIYGIVPGVAWDYKLAAWRDRARQQWRAIAEQYDLAYVLSPNTVPLDLPPALTDAACTLYAAP